VHETDAQERNGDFSEEVHLLVWILIEDSHLEHRVDVVNVTADQIVYRHYTM